MAQADNAVQLIEQAAKCEGLASDYAPREDSANGAPLCEYWQRCAQTQATLAVATALLAVDETLRLMTRKVGQL